MKPKFTVEQQLNVMMELISAAGYFPSVTVSSAKLPASLCKEYRVTVPDVDRELMRANNTRPEHYYVPCWNIMVLVSGGYPLVPGGLYCNTIQEGLDIMVKMAKEFCHRYWHGDDPRPTKHELGLR